MYESEGEFAVCVLKDADTIGNVTVDIAQAAKQATPNEGIYK